jgi:hypothetical protein
MGREFEDRCCCISRIVTKHCSALCCDHKVVLRERMPLAGFNIFCVFLKSIFDCAFSDGPLTDIANINDSIVATSQEQLLIKQVPSN